jgi:hypothetical protein
MMPSISSAMSPSTNWRFRTKPGNPRSKLTDTREPTADERRCSLIRDSIRRHGVGLGCRMCSRFLAEAVHGRQVIRATSVARFHGLPSNASNTRFSEREPRYGATKFEHADYRRMVFPLPAPRRTTPYHCQSQSIIALDTDSDDIFSLDIPPIFLYSPPQESS